ncbi:TRAP transporter substrate-binding protein [soil metagenome]
MDRRSFIKKAGLVTGGAATTLAAPAIAQSAPTVKWRLTSAFPKSLDTIFGAADTFAKAVSEATDGKFQIQTFANGEVLPLAGIVEGVQKSTVEMAHTASYYYFGIDPTFAFGTAVPFGLNPRQQNAWNYYGGGVDMMNEFYKKYNIYGLPMGNTGTQMGGWYRKEINTPADLNGLKMRIGGFAGTVLAKLGLVPTQVAGGDIYPSLEKGTIDAAEWVGTYDDAKLGFQKVAKYYYYPGWWEGGAMLHLFVNIDRWNELPKSYQSIVRTAATMASVDIQAQYDPGNPAALRRLVAGGAILKPFSKEVLDACFKAATDTYAETSAKNADFKKVFDSIKAYRAEEYLWYQVADATFDSYMASQQRAGAL